MSDTAIGFTAVEYQAGGSTAFQVHANCVECRLESANVRYRLDGTDPTSDEGILLQAGETLLILGYHNINRFRAIKDGDDDGTLKVHFGWG